MSAGASAAAKAAQLRQTACGGLLRRVLALLGWDRRGARAEHVARCWDAGAEGEGRTAELLAPLGGQGGEGWFGFYDRALPGGGRANADHVLVSPCGRLLVNVDSKLWSGRFRVHSGAGGLWHGTVDRTRSLKAVRHETRRIQEGLRERGVHGVRVVTVIAVHNAPVTGGGFETGGVRVIPAGRLLTVLRGLAGMPDAGRAMGLAVVVGGMLPRYVQDG